MRAALLQDAHEHRTRSVHARTVTPACMLPRASPQGPCASIAAAGGRHDSPAAQIPTHWSAPQAASTFDGERMPVRVSVTPKLHAWIARADVRVHGSSYRRGRAAGCEVQLWITAPEMPKTPLHPSESRRAGMAAPQKQKHYWCCLDHTYY